MTIRDVFRRLREERVDLSDGYLSLLWYAAVALEDSCGPIDVEQLTADHVRQMMRMVHQGAAASTVNNYRRYAYVLWDFAHSKHWTGPPDRSARRYKEIKRAPTAWTIAELEHLLRTAEQWPAQRDWSGEHWACLITVAYETSLRIGCLLSVPLTALHESSSRLLIPGEFQKHRRDSHQSLRPATVARLKALPRPVGDKRLFPWPFVRDELWRKFAKILVAAGLPATGRDKFHKLRRTSYTLVAKSHGIAVASRHAGHSTDMSRYYLDQTQYDDRDPLTALPDVG